MKAGAETPATAGGACPRRASASPLNEGRGRNPGDSVGAVAPEPGGHPRSMKAGAETPATVERRCRPSLISRSALNEGRGRNPGDSSVSERGEEPNRAPLNEGRGRNPGDSSHVLHGRKPKGGRSMKAGAETPATGLIAVEKVNRGQLDCDCGPQRPTVAESHNLHGPIASPPICHLMILAPSAHLDRAKAPSVPESPEVRNSTHMIQGWPTSRAGGRPRHSRASLIVPAKRYTITESRFGSITSWNSPVIRATRVGERRHSKTDFWTRCP